MSERADASPRPRRSPSPTARAARSRRCRRAQEERLLPRLGDARGAGATGRRSTTPTSASGTPATDVPASSSSAACSRCSCASSSPCPDNDFLSAETLQPGLHAARLGDDVPLRRARSSRRSSIMLLPQMLGARDLPFPRLSAFGFWSFLHRRRLLLRLDLLRRRAARRLVHVPAADHRGTRPDIGADIWLLGLLVHRGGRDRRGGRADRRRAQVPPAGHAHQPDPALRLVHAGGGGDDPVRVPAAHRRRACCSSSSARSTGRSSIPTRGGDPLLWQHLFWIFGHPEVYIVFLPSIALVAMIVPTFARTPIVGYGWIVLAAVGTGFLSFGLWVHHMFTTGLPGISLGLFSAASQAVAIPTGVQIFCFLATLLAGRVVALGADALRASAASPSSSLGGLTGVMVALAPFDFQAHDTLLRRRPPALRADRRHALPDRRRASTTSSRSSTGSCSRERLGPHRLLADVRRLQRRLPADAPDRPARDAAPGLHLSARAWASTR